MVLMYTEEDLRNPIGANSLAPEAMFFQRALYKNKIYPTNVPRPLDTWYEKPLFGRVDRVQNTVMPKSTRIRAIPRERAITPNIYVLNFVDLAFGRLVRHIGVANLTARLDPTGNKAIRNIKAVQGYQPPNVKYDSYLQTLINSYISSLPEDRNEKVVNFASFCEDFAPYILFMAQTYPVTKTNFLLGNFVSPFCSGLSIAIAQDPAGDDAVKYRRFLEDPNFTFYAGAAKKFGFLVNKNMPWVLTADLFSPAIMEYLNVWQTADEQPITRINFFWEWYNATYRTDLMDLRALFKKGYETLLDRNLYYQEKTLWCNDELKTSVLARQPYDEDAASLVLTPNFLLNLYVDLRQTESRDAVSPSKVAHIKRKALLLYRAAEENARWSGYPTAGRFVNKIYRQSVYNSPTLNLKRQRNPLDNAADSGYTTIEGGGTPPQRPPQGY